MSTRPYINPADVTPHAIAHRHLETAEHHLSEINESWARAALEHVRAALQIVADAPDAPTCLEDLLEIAETADVDDDLSEFPTFGGADLPSDAEVYSWDDERVLVGPGGARDPHQAFMIISRAEYAKRGP